jgi:hypothetical protein
LVILFDQVKNLFISLYPNSNIMTDIFQIDEGFDSLQDENLKYIEEVVNRTFELHSGLIFVESKELESDYRNAIKKLKDPKNQSWGILEQDVADILQELARLVRIFKGYYLTGVDKYVHPSSSLSPQKIQYITNKLMIRIKRLVCVLDPDYSIIKFKDKKTLNNYTMIKGYWINENGKRVRSISRNIGNTESTMNDLTIKLFEKNNKNLVQMEHESGSKFNVDLTVYDGKINWAVETKLMNQENFVKTFVMFEFWKVYKQEYELLD